MAAKPSPSPFKFGFYAGLGFMCAQIVFGLLVASAVLILGIGTFMSAAAKSIGTQAPGTLMTRDSAEPAAYAPSKSAHR